MRVVNSPASASVQECNAFPLLAKLEVSFSSPWNFQVQMVSLNCACLLKRRVDV